MSLFQKAMLVLSSIFSLHIFPWIYLMPFRKTDYSPFNSFNNCSAQFTFYFSLKPTLRLKKRLASFLVVKEQREILFLCQWFFYSLSEMVIQWYIFCYHLFFPFSLWTNKTKPSLYHGCLTRFAIYINSNFLSLTVILSLSWPSRNVTIHTFFLCNIDLFYFILFWAIFIIWMMSFLCSSAEIMISITTDLASFFTCFH